MKKEQIQKFETVALTKKAKKYNSVNKVYHITDRHEHLYSNAKIQMAKKIQV